MQDLVKMQAERTILMQFALFLVLAFFVQILISVSAAVSIILGGLTTVIPAFVFMTCAFTHAGARRAARILCDFYLGMVLKFVFIALLFYVFFRFFQPNGSFFMLGFIMTQISTLMAPRLLLVLDRRVA